MYIEESYATIVQDDMRLIPLYRQRSYRTWLCGEARLEVKLPGSAVSMFYPALPQLQPFYPEGPDAISVQLPSAPQIPAFV